MTNTQSQISDWMGRTVRDTDGDKVGTIADIYADDTTGQPDWLAVNTGMFGTKTSFVPVDGASLTDDDVVVGYTKAMIKDAPRVDADGQLSIEEEQTLYGYYGRSYDSTLAAAETRRNTTPAAAPVADTPRVGAADTGVSVTRSEEELSVDKHRQEAGRVKLRKWVETQDVHVTVPVERQMAKVVREPVRDGDGAGAFTEGEEEIVLSEEVLDVSKRAVAKERIGLETVTETRNVDVDEKVRKERVDVDGDGRFVDSADR